MAEPTVGNRQDLYRAASDLSWTFPLSTLPQPSNEDLVCLPYGVGHGDEGYGKCVDWMIKIGKSRYDIYSVYDLTMTPNGEVIVAAIGEGELLVGTKGVYSDGIVTSFDSSGKKRFARRIGIRLRVRCEK